MTYTFKELLEDGKHLVLTASRSKAPEAIVLLKKRGKKSVGTLCTIEKGKVVWNDDMRKLVSESALLKVSNHIK
jgi:hypothetical protein